MEVPAASLAQVTRARDGRLVEITDDVQGIANALAQIDHHLSLRYSETGEYWVVYWRPEGSEYGDGDLITTTTELDHRLVKRIEFLYWQARQPGYSFADEVEAQDAAAEREREHQFSERVGEIGERLAHALRKDLQVKSKIVVPADVRDKT
jgi:hypothetical protein